MSLRAISIYTGFGGLDFGFEAAGFDTTVALDLDPVACSALRANRNWPVLEGEVSQFSSQRILDTAGLSLGEADVLIGGPPCQPFSKSGYWATGDARRLDDPRADTLGQYLRILRDTLPKTFLIENVLGLAYAKKSEGLDFIRRGIAAINAETGTCYAMSVQALNAADYGVPQVRERVFVVGSRDGATFRFPAPTHAAEPGTGRHAWRSAWDALGDLPQNLNDPTLAMTGKWADLLPSIPEGRNYLWHTHRGGGKPLFGWRTRYWNFLLKLAKNQPAWTIQAQPGPATGPFHWRNRRLAAIELGRLQTFPDGLRYDASRNDIQRLVGNAVPSALAEAMAREIRGLLLQRPLEAAGPLTLIPSARQKPPGPERVGRVPSKYLLLSGTHADHPGTGKGRRATGRLEQAA